MSIQPSGTLQRRRQSTTALKDLKDTAGWAYQEENRYLSGSARGSGADALVKLNPVRFKTGQCARYARAVTDGRTFVCV